MKFSLALLAILATIGLSQAYTLPDINESYEDNDSLMDTLSFDLSFTYPSNKLTLRHEIEAFINLIPEDKFIDVIAQYLNDEKLLKAIQYMYTSEFHSLLRNLESTKEHQALVIFLEKAGLEIIAYIKRFHKFINMEDYVPPKIEEESEFEIGAMKSSGGMKAMYNDLINILPHDKIKVLYEKKMKDSKVFSEFVKKMTSSDFQKLVAALQGQKAFQDFTKKSVEHEIDFQGAENFTRKLVPIPYPQIFK